MVLLLLPTSTSKLLAQWTLSCFEEDGSSFEMPHHKKQIYHISLLKIFESPSAQCYAASEVSEDNQDDEDDLPDWRHGNTAQPTIGSQLSPQQKTEMKELLKEFWDVFGSVPGRTTLTEHKISTNHAKPIRLPPYRIPYAHRDAVTKELEEMERRGIISQSEWSAPIVVVLKKDGNIRLCVDYCRLNEVTPTDAYPMPRVDELMDRLGKAKYISTLDLYWQVPMAKDDRSKTAFTTPKGLFQFTVMPFGLKGAPATFQRMMDKLLRGLEDHSAAYIDDIVIYSETWEMHREFEESYSD